MGKNDTFWEQVQKILPVYHPIKKAPPVQQGPSTILLVPDKEQYQPSPEASYGPAEATSFIDKIRTAGKNHVLLQMVYNSTPRLVEPYSFRMKRTGLVFYAYCYIHNNTESFRLDRIEGLLVTNQKYTPRYKVEF